MTLRRKMKSTLKNHLIKEATRAAPRKNLRTTKELRNGRRMLREESMMLSMYCMRLVSLKRTGSMCLATQKPLKSPKHHLKHLNLYRKIKIAIKIKFRLLRD